MIDPLDGLLGYQLRRASVVMMADLAATLAPLALRPTEASVLLAIEANPQATQSDIGRSLSVQRANMAPIVAMLCSRRLVERAAADGRSHRLLLSTDGAVVAAQVREAITAHEARFLPDLPAAPRRALIAALRTIRETAPR